MASVPSRCTREPCYPSALLRRRQMNRSQQSIEILFVRIIYIIRETVGVRFFVCLDFLIRFYLLWKIRNRIERVHADPTVSCGCKQTQPYRAGACRPNRIVRVLADPTASPSGFCQHFAISPYIMWQLCDLQSPDWCMPFIKEVNWNDL